MRNTLVFELLASQAANNLRMNWNPYGMSKTNFKNPRFDVGFGGALLVLHKAGKPMHRREIQIAMDKCPGSNQNMYNTMRAAGLIKTVMVAGAQQRKGYALTEFGEAYIRAWLTDVKLKFDELNA